MAKAWGELAWDGDAPLRTAPHRRLLFLCLAASLAFHGAVIALFESAHRARGAVPGETVIPVDLTWLPHERSQPASGAAAPAAARRPGPLHAPAPKLDLGAPSRAGAQGLGALWSDLCQGFDPKDIAALDLPDCNPSVHGAPPKDLDTVIAAHRLAIEALAHRYGWLPPPALPRALVQEIDRGPPTASDWLSTAPVPPPVPVIGAGSKLADDVKDDTDLLKALWYLQDHHEDPTRRVGP